MRRLLAALLFVGTAAHGAASFKGADFAMELDSDWVQLRLRFAEHVAFFSKSRSMTLKVDSVPAPLKRRTPQEAARVMLDGAVKHAQEEESVKVTDQAVSARKNGGVMLTYAGITKTQARLRFVGLIEGNKFVYMQFESRTASEKELEAAVRAVLDRFRVIP